jgi:hypothetical protein
MKKRAFITIDVLRSGYIGLNASQSVVASFLYTQIALIKKPVVVDGECYYPCDPKTAFEYCAVVTDKKDTLYRIYKVLEKKGLIKLKNVGGTTHFTSSEYLRSWGCDKDAIEELFIEGSETSENFPRVGNKSEGRKIFRGSEINPRVGNKSENFGKFSEKNEGTPYYANINVSNITNDINNNILSHTQDARAREKSNFEIDDLEQKALEEILEDKISLEAFCMKERINIIDFENLARSVLTDWKVAGARHRDIADARSHLISTIRIEIKNNRLKTPNTDGNRTNPYQSIDERNAANIERQRKNQENRLWEIEQEWRRNRGVDPDGGDDEDVAFSDYDNV